MQKTVSADLGGRTLSIETGRIAKQASGAVLVRHGDSVIMVTAVWNPKIDPSRGWLPLFVDYREKAYAAGKIPGGFFKREGRPGEAETLNSRLIDRPLRPLFPDGYLHETQIMATVLSFDKENATDVLGLTGASAALALSDIPFNTLVSAVRVGRVDGQLLVNPTLPQMEESDMDVVVAGTDDFILMVEGGCDEVVEADMIEALDFAHAEIKKLNELQRQLVTQAGKTKVTFQAAEQDSALRDKVTSVALPEIQKINDARMEKLDRYAAVADLANRVVEQLLPEFPEQEGAIRHVVEEVEKKEMRRVVVEKGERADGRRPDEIRPISIEVGVLPRTHGSALFTRGETQALVVATLGTSKDEQRMDSLAGESMKRFMLHYNFPPYSVNEVSPIRGTGRREIGHGALAERALSPMVPGEEDFPYTLRLVSEITESNGSSSMASVCGGSLALMDAGVPIKTPVAGIAMGAIFEDGKHVILSDILGLEDHLGDMDFKVTGSRQGITAFQMDVKVSGVTREFMAEALAQAKRGREHILGKMEAVLDTSRTDLSPFAPKISTVQINPDKIRDIIGPGGKVIRAITAESGASIDVDDTGLVRIAAVDQESGDKAMAMIKEIVAEAELDAEYDGLVRRITDFGAFVQILPNKDGLLHISEIAHHRINSVSDVLKEGDTIRVRVIGIDPEGKVRLSHKILLPVPEGAYDNGGGRDEQRSGGGGGRHHSGSGGGRHGGRRGGRGGGGGGRR
jgi:polyribonucleotide nucleotidyltransferase